VRTRARFVDAADGGLADVEVGLDALKLARSISLRCRERWDRRRACRSPAAGRTGRSSGHGAGGRDRAVAAGTRRRLDSDVVSVSEWLALLQAIKRLTGAARALAPADLVAPGTAPGAIDTAELQTRADQAENRLRQALTALRQPAAGEAALLGALHSA